MINNITIYTSSDFPNGGAAENLVRQMALGINSLGTKVNVVLFRGHTNDKTRVNDTNIDCSYLLFEKRPENEIIKFVELFLIILSVPISIIRNRKRFKSKFIILYGIEYFYYVFPFYITGLLFNIKIYRIVTDRYPDRTIAPSWWKLLKVFFYRFQFRYFDKYLSGIICLSNYLRENAIFYGVKASKICLIPHFIDINLFCSESIKTLPFSRERIRIGLIGSLNENNGLFVLLKAFCLVKSAYSNIELCLIGSLSEEDMIISLQILGDVIDSVIFIGKAHDSMIPSLLSSCDLLVIPRKSSTFAEASFPTKLGEYLSTGRPIIATEVGEIKRIFKDKRELILVKPDSSESLKEGILFLINNKDMALRIGECGYYWALNNIEYRNSARILLNFMNIGNKK
jgi:glycosyltransferase involved in cell wall biosynthesis